MASVTWPNISTVDADKLNAARRQAHNAVHWLVRLANSYTEPGDVSGQAPLVWDASDNVIMTKPFLDKYSVELRVGPLEMQFREGGKPVPHTLDLVLAASLPTPGLTGVEMIDDDLNVTLGDRVLVIGALGGVGRAAVFAARRRGATVTAAVRTGRTGEASAADTVIETGEACHVEFDAICDTVGGEIAAVYYSNLKSGGVFCSVSTNRLPPPTRDDIVVRNFVCYPDVQKLAELAVAAASGFDFTGPLDTLPLSAASAAHTRLEAGERKKFVLSPGASNAALASP